MPKFRKRPVVIEAQQYDGTLASIAGVLAASKQTEVGQDLIDPDLIIPTLEGEMRAEVGDWVICGTHGELYPVKSEIFSANYEPAE